MAYDARESLWSTPFDEIEPTPLLPNGHYYVQIMGYQRRVVEKTGTEWLDINCQVTEPGADIDQTAINGLDLREYELRMSFAITKRAFGFIQDFLTSMGFRGRPLDSVVDELTGMRALATVSTREYQQRGKTRQINNIDELVGAE